jgi:uncharacterized protein YkwD
VLSLLNGKRKQLGLRKLRLDKAATKVARAHSRDMCLRRYFSHTNPDGKQPWHRLRAGGVKFRAAAENIASGQRTAREVHLDWMQSPGHRRNRLNRRYRRAGVGLYMCGSMPYWTEVFMR